MQWSMKDRSYSHSSSSSNPNMQDSFLQIHKTTMQWILRSPGKLWSESERGRLAVMASGKSSCRRPETESGFIRSCDATLLKIKEVANLLSIEPVWACGGGWTDGRPPSTPACTSPCCSRRGSLAKLMIMMMLLFEKWKTGKDPVSVNDQVDFQFLHSSLYAVIFVCWRGDVISWFWLWLFMVTVMRRQFETFQLKIHQGSV